MHLIVGLGNPGDKYKNNRHNVGFLCVDDIACKYNAADFTTKFSAYFSACQISGNKVLLLKPQTYMNLSGKAVIECMNFYKVPIANVIVIHDELDLECGRIKIKTGGSSAGHNGLKSIDASIGNNYVRLRFGVSRPEHSTEVSSYVLSDFYADQINKVENSIKIISLHAPSLIAGDFANFMNNCALDQKSMEKKNEL